MSTSRRRLLAAAGAGLLLPGCGSRGNARSKPRRTSTSDRADAQVLDELLVQEHRLVAAYTALRPELGAAHAKLADLLIDHERKHAIVLEIRIVQLGGRYSRPESRYELPHRSGRDAALSLTADLEQQTIALYLDALPKLADPTTRAAIAALMAVEAEHLSLVSIARGEPPIGPALVQGVAHPGGL